MADEAFDLSGALGGAGDREEKNEEDHILKITEAYFQESDGARWERMSLNRRNRNVYMGRQDWGHKEEGQSTEFIPKTSTAIESFAGFIKRGLTQFGNWFTVDIPQETGIRGDDIVAMIQSYLSRMPSEGNGITSFAHTLSDGVKSGLMESVIILKAYGVYTKKTTYSINAVTGKASRKTIKPWELRVDLIPTEDYYPDPTGAHMYEIHEVERDVSSVMKMADMGAYDKEMVADMILDMDEKRHGIDVDARNKEKNLDKGAEPSMRKKCVLRECWGNILDEDGSILHENVTWTVANNKYLIRKPTKNPYWHERSPFIVIPIIRVPHTVWHKALFDQCVALNEAINEMFNLMLDGGLASVWGIKQCRIDWLEDARQVAGGISQGTTLLVNDSAPADAEVLKQVSTGEIPADAMAMYNVLDKEFNAAALTNDIKLGLLPTKEVKATEIVEASQSQAVTLDAIIADIEWYLVEFLRMIWMLMVQNADDLETARLDSSAGRRLAVMLARLNKEERYAVFGSMTGFAVHGLTATMARARDFQRLMALLQAIQVNPVLLQSFHRRYSEDKILQQLMKNTNLNPEIIERTPEEIETIDAEMEQAAALNAAGVTGNNTASPPGEAGQQSDIAQNQQPTAGV